MILEKEDAERIHRIITDSGFRHFVPVFTKLLRLSRIPILKYNGFFVGFIQLILLKHISSFELAVKEKRVRILGVETEEEKENLIREIDLSQEALRVLRTIADGIAWRNLEFRRPLLVLLSQNEGPGRVDPKYPGLKKILGSKDVILINDITRFLRTGDLTAIYKNGKVVIYEMKKKGEKIKDLVDIFKELKQHKRMPTPQEMRQWVAQRAIMEKKIWSPVFENGKTVRDIEVEITDLDFPIKTHLATIQKLIKIAGGKGYVRMRLEDGLYVEVRDYEVMTKRKPWKKVFEEFKKDFEAVSPEWMKNKNARKIFITTHEGFFQEQGEFVRGMTPPSILPLRTKDCARIMSGQLYISIHLDIDYLKKRIEQFGWQVEEVNPPRHKSRKIFFEELKKRRKGPIGPLERESIFFLSNNSGARTNLPYAVLMIMLSSFYKTDFILDYLGAIEKSIDFRTHKGKLFETNFVGEKEIFV